MIPSHRILFYETKIGKIAILRQLKPSIHIEYDSNVCLDVSPFMKVLLINKGDGLQTKTGHWKRYSNIQEIFTTTTINK